MNKDELEEAVKEIGLKEIAEQRYKHNLGLNIIMSIQNTALLIIACYMSVNYGLLWLLLLLLWSHIKSKDNKEKENE